MSLRHKCDARCHSAKGPPRRCRCWCRGLFHGAQGAEARAAFVQAAGGDIPADGPQAQGELFQPGVTHFDAGMAAARAVAEARREQSNAG